MSSCKSLHNRESDFVETVSQFVNFISVVVVRNNYSSWKFYNSKDLDNFIHKTLRKNIGNYER